MVGISFIFEAMKSYVRKLFDHDLTHEVSVQSMYLWRYFTDYDSGMTFYNVNQPSKDYSVYIRNVTDPRFGGQFKSIYRRKNPREGDFLVITKVAPRRYSLELVKLNSRKYDCIAMMFAVSCVAERHAILDL